MMLRHLAFSALAAAIVIPGLAVDVKAQVESPYQNREERQLYGGEDSSNVLDATNPMDLINRLRQSGMMDNATPPSDAIDAALKAYETAPASPAAP